MYGDKNSGPCYYNVEKTENPYIIACAECEIENLSDTFKVFEKSLYYTSMPTLKICKVDGRAKFYTIDEETVRQTLSSYKNQLLENKHKPITDNYLNYEEYSSHIFRQYLDEAGLTLSIDGVVSLKRVYKPRNKAATANKREVNRWFQRSLEHFFHTTFGTTCRIDVVTKDLYTILSRFKRVFPKVTFKEVTGNTDRW